MPSTVNTDRAALALSSACIAHCVALPVLSLVLPFAGTLAEIAIIHWMLAASGILTSVSVVLRARDARAPHFLVPAGLGSLPIIFGIFAEQFGARETLPTILGGLLLAAAHLGRINQHHAHGRTPAQ